MFTYQDLKMQVLALMDEYSIDGQLIGTDENKDYLLRIPLFANKVQLEIAQMIKIPAYYTVEHTADEAALYAMPADFKEIDKIVKDDILCDLPSFILKDRKTLKLKDKGSYDIHYFKYPTKIDSSTLDAFILDVYEEAAQLIPFKVASLIIQGEKPDISSRLLQIYENDLARIINNQVQEPQMVQSIYSIGG